MTEHTEDATQPEEQDSAQEPEEYYCGLHGFVPISHFPCPGE